MVETIANAGTSSSGFDVPIDRTRTYSSKWDRAGDMLPMGTADMDFRAPDCVLAAGKQAMDHGVIGYGSDIAGYNENVSWWMQERHDWTIAPDRIVPIPGTLAGLALTIETFTLPGEGVVIFEPLYSYFRSTIEACNRQVVSLQLREIDGTWKLPDGLCDLQLGGSVRLLAFCSPHNPVGRVWTPEELEQVLAFARRNGLAIVSDEIHHDLVYKPNVHTPFTKIARPQDTVITLAGVAKTFNLPGLSMSSAVFSNKEQQSAFENRVSAMCLYPPAVCVAMGKAAYSPEGAAWLDACVDYLEENKRILMRGFDDLPGFTMTPPEAMYLAWVKTANSDVDGQTTCSRAGIHALAGQDFGAGCSRYFRLNFATQRPRVTQALTMLRDAFPGTDA